MIISVMRWRGVAVMSGRVLRMRSVASPMMGIRGLLGASGRTVGKAVGVRAESALVATASAAEGVRVGVGVCVGHGVGVKVGMGVRVGVAVIVAVGVGENVGEGVGVGVRVGVGV